MEHRNKLRENAKTNPGYGMKGKKHTEATKKILRIKRAIQIFPMRDTSIERKIQRFLHKAKIEFIKHHLIRDINSPYRCDIFIPSRNLIIECDGEYWHNYPYLKPVDRERTKELREKGFNVIRLWGMEIKNLSFEEFVHKPLANLHTK